MAIIETKGHRDDQPGLRGHSVGDIYPFIISGIGTDEPGKTLWYLHHVTGWQLRTPDGDTARLSYQACDAIARTLIDNKWEPGPEAVGFVFSVGDVTVTCGDGRADGRVEQGTSTLLGYRVIYRQTGEYFRTPANGLTTRIEEAHLYRKVPGCYDPQYHVLDPVYQ